jgi:dTDP-4-amino-4,6-dideoxygalactose transaminase
MDGIQGAVLRVKLRHLEQGNDARRAHAELYATLLGGDEAIRLPRQAEGRKHVYHLYPVRIQRRDAVLDRLSGLGIHCGIHYPIPVHLQEAYRSLNLAEGTFPVAERCAREFLSLPMFPELTREQIEAVSRELKQAVSGFGGASGSSR